MVVAPGVLEDAVTVKSTESGIFSINGVVIDSSVKSEMTISESGTYTVKVSDAAGNEATVSFVVSMPEEELPVVDEKPQSNGGMGWILYVLGGMVAGAGICGLGFYFMNKKRNEDYYDDEDED